jgi:hypothetical protein
MSVERASSIQKFDSDDPIVARQQYPADFSDSIDPTTLVELQKCTTWQGWKRSVQYCRLNSRYSADALYGTYAGKPMSACIVILTLHNL